MSSSLSSLNSSSSFYSPEKLKSKTTTISPLSRRIDAVMLSPAAGISARNLLDLPTVEETYPTSDSYNLTTCYSSTPSSSIEVTDLFMSDNQNSHSPTLQKRFLDKAPTPTSQKKQRLSPCSAVSSSTLTEKASSISFRTLSFGRKDSSKENLSVENSPKKSTLSVPISSFFTGGCSSSDSENSSAPSSPEKGSQKSKKRLMTPQKMRQLLERGKSDEITYREASSDDIILTFDAHNAVESHPRKEEFLRDLTYNTLKILEVPEQERYRTPSKMRPQTHQTLYHAPSLAHVLLNFPSKISIYNPEHIIDGDETGGGHTGKSAGAEIVESSQGVLGQLVLKPRPKFSSIFPTQNISEYINRAFTISQTGCVCLKTYSYLASLVYESIKSISVVEPNTSTFANRALSVSYLISQYCEIRPNFYLETVLAISSKENALVSVYNKCVEARMSPSKIQMVKKKNELIEKVKTTYPIFYYKIFSSGKSYQIEKEGRVFTNREISIAIQSAVNKVSGRINQGYNQVRFKVLDDYVVDIAPEFFPEIKVPRGIYFQINTKDFPKLKNHLQTFRFD